MNDPDNFLSRWSRRKREADESKHGEEDKAVANPVPESQQRGPVTEPDTAAPEFDIEDLPSIETISADTDITDFMRTRVPEALKHAALRRAWSSDPRIRDFVELNENYWDAAGPDGIPGFGDLDPNLDVQRLVSELFGETPRQDTSSQSQSDDVADSSGSPAQKPPAAISPTEPTVVSDNLPQSNENAAAQTEPPQPASEKKFARRHGGAMPR
ncbi:MAG TPA: DUF3306 domain-containing protein [Pseudolabrys sp.]|nr:DUF3306 domain-containing protein [Pseudolabrys sp.]